jgi:outer membrane protein W
MRRFVLLAVAAVVFGPSVAAGQVPGQGTPAWTLGTRVFITSASDPAEPGGYRLYSGAGTEIRLTRTVGRHFGLEWTAGTYSREATWTYWGDWGEYSVGAVDVIPVGMLLQYHPFSIGRFRPYLGAGATWTMFPNTSGELDWSELTSEIGPTGQIGIDINVSSRIVLNADYRINRLKTDFEYDGVKAATLTLNPSVLGVGISVRF